jgi:hypothetical protein
MKIKIMLPGYYSQHHVVYIPNRNRSFSSISRDYIALPAPCQIFMDRSTWLESSISRSPASDVQIHFIDLICHTALLLLIFIPFRDLDRIMSYDQSKRVIKVDTFDRSKFWEGRNVNIAISSKKIKIRLLGNYSKHHVV